MYLPLPPQLSGWMRIHSSADAFISRRADLHYSYLQCSQSEAHTGTLPSAVFFPPQPGRSVYCTLHVTPSSPAIFPATQPESAPIMPSITTQPPPQSPQRFPLLSLFSFVLLFVSFPHKAYVLVLVSGAFAPFSCPHICAGPSHVAPAYVTLFMRYIQRAP
ncbi:hypothetical protein CALCODRAFT_502388 [Calocera cornea HHB12733]|uniref:Uncharacterized protein n=1 Tax=Calocera cornea HHB12733 TaxID=1353952 RepID=A0A165DA77_9BASI|nr:hypothetical protein CALCODRAFT_502388 [Calocera cornea HHB12733]